MIRIPEIDCDGLILPNYRILIMAPIVRRKTLGGLVIPCEAVENEQKQLNLGKVLLIGDTCFDQESTKHTKVNVGSWIVYSRVEREIFPNRKSIDDVPVYTYLINDTQVIGVVSEDYVNRIANG